MSGEVMMKGVELECLQGNSRASGGGNGGVDW